MVDCAEATAAGVPATGDEGDELVDEEELKRLHGASRTKNICRELLRAALIAKRPSTTPHPVYDLLDEPDENAWSQLPQLRTITNARFSSASLFQNVEISLKDTMIFLAHNFKVFEEYGKLGTNSNLAVDCLNELIAEEQWFFAGKRPPILSDESFRSNVKTLVLTPDPEENEETGKGDEAGNVQRGSVVDLIDGRVKAQLRAAISEERWLKDPEREAVLKKVAEQRSTMDKIVEKAKEIDVAAKSKQDSESDESPDSKRLSLGGLTTTQAENHSTVMSAHADLVAAEARKLEMEAKKRKVDFEAELAAKRFEFEKDEKATQAVHDREMQR